MRARQFIREITSTLPPGKEPMGMDPEVATEPIQQANTQAITPTIKKTKSVDGPYVFNGVTYADRQQANEVAIQIKNTISKDFPTASVNVDRAQPNVGKLIPAIRILNALPKEQVKQQLQSLFQLNTADAISGSVTGTYIADTYSFDINNVRYTVILAGKGSKQAGSQTGAQVGIQQLRPNKLGLTGDNTKARVVEIVKQSLVNVVGKDPKLLEALRQLVDVAAGARETIDPELNAHIKDSVNLISQDFGEVLTPIKMAESDEDIINFPEQSNQPLIDAKINGKPIAVKSLGGSGNSFSVIQDLIKEYEEEINKDPTQVADERKRMLNLIKEFNKSKGDVKDNLIRVAQLAPTEEAIALNNLVGFTPNNYKEMIKAVNVIMNNISATATSKDDMYKMYLEAVLPISTAGTRLTSGKNPKVQAIGMPSDWQHYTGKKDIKDLKAKSSGKKYFDANFVNAAADQLTYLLGWSFKLDASDKGKDANEMSNLITDIMTKKKAVAAKIVITPNGGIELKVTPFSDLKFGYQYHAGTSRPAQNAPGFTIHFID
jgi:hypothetical protein